MADPNAEIPTIIGPDASFKGELQFDKGVQLLGRFEGQITSGGQLIIGKGATLCGDVKAGTIRVDGEVKGNLNADSKVQLSATARLEGDVQAARLEVTEGAILIGRCVVGVDGQGKAAGPIKAAPAEMLTPAKGKPAQAAVLAEKH